MARKRELAKRFGTMLMALLFLATSVGFSILVIWQVKQDRNREQEQAATTQLLENQNNTGKLEGTALAKFKPVKSVKTLQIIDLKEGKGAAAKKGDKVTIHYTGALVKNGTIFQSSHDLGQPYTDLLSNLIVGWQKGVPGMKIGGKRRLLIPAKQAYGPQERTGIPANSDLVFDIELIALPE